MEPCRCPSLNSLTTEIGLDGEGDIVQKVMAFEATVKPSTETT